MRIVVYGAGAVGGLVGGLLFRAGVPVTLIARGDHLAALRSTGLHLQTPHLDQTLRVPAVGGPGEVDWQGDETVLLAVKSDATPVVGPLLAAAAPSTVTVASLQNGVANEPALARWFASVLGVVVMCPSTHLAPGSVRGTSAGAPAILDLGCWPSGVDAAAGDLGAAFGAAGIVSEPRSDVMAWKHRKLLTNVGNAVDACCRPGGAATALARDATAEGEAVLAAAGIAVVSREEDLARRGDLLRGGVTGADRGGSSTWQSLERGTGAVETDYLNGELVRLGRAVGTPTPLNLALQLLARRMAASGEPPRSVDPASLR